MSSQQISFLPNEVNKIVVLVLENYLGLQTSDSYVSKGNHAPKTSVGEQVHSAEG